MTPRETNGRDRGSRPAGKAGSRKAPVRGAPARGAPARGAKSRGDAPRGARPAAGGRGGRDDARPARPARAGGVDRGERAERGERPARGSFAPTDKPTRGERYDRPARAARPEPSERDQWSAQPPRPERVPRPERGDGAGWREREAAKKAPKRPPTKRPRPPEPPAEARPSASRAPAKRPARAQRPEATTLGGGDVPLRRGGPQLPAGAPGRGPSRLARREQARGLDRPVGREEARPAPRPARAIVRDVAPDGTRTVRPDTPREAPRRAPPVEEREGGARPQRPVRDRKAGSSSARKPRPKTSEERAALALSKAPPAATGPMRLQRVLARAGLSSRRQAETLIAAGRVLVNGKPAQLGQTVDMAHDAVTLDGAPVKGPVAAQWMVLHKPAGTLTTRRDPQGRPTVFDLLPEIAGLTYVGRLDYMTEGVLLMTTDGDAAHRLTHPSHEVERTYVATVRGNAAAAVRQARKGVELDDGVVHPTDVDSRPLGNRRYEFVLTITEGRTREVRRVCEALGLEVEKLVRVQFGPVKLGGLPAGSVRPLTVTELRVIEALAHEAPRPRAEDLDRWDDES